MLFDLKYIGVSVGNMGKQKWVHFLWAAGLPACPEAKPKGLPQDLFHAVHEGVRRAQR